MQYQKFKPHPDLSFYVECYYVWESDKIPDEPLQVESPPPAFTSIVFNYGDEYFVSSLGTARQRTPKQFLVGQQSHSYTLHLPGKIGIAAIVFKPTGIASIFRIPMYAVAKERIDLQVFIAKQEIDTIMSELTCSSSAREKADLLESFVFRYFFRSHPIADVIDHGANIIVEKHGVVNVDELCSQLYISRRQFERRFLQKVGISPKYYARLRRIGYICAQLAGKEKVNWQNIYFDFDYYDQSHFIKDFTEFTSRSPSEYFQNNKELIHFLTTEK